MRGIKIPQQDFALKMQGGGGLCSRGEVRICGTLRYLIRVTCRIDMGSRVTYSTKYSLL